MTAPIIQVAGVTDPDEAGLLIDCGVTHIGIPLRLPVNVEDVTDAEAAEIVASLGQAVPVLITYLTRGDEIIALCDAIGCRMVQVHGPANPGELVLLRTRRPDISIVKSLVVGERPAHDLLETVTRYAPVVDAFITDTYDPATGASGATGRVHDWMLDRQLVELSPLPVIAAGGLTPTNVAAAIRAVHPAGVDVHTGVEGPDGRKRRDLVEAFVEEARVAFNEAVDGG